MRKTIRLITGFAQLMLALFVLGIALHSYGVIEVGAFETLLTAVGGGSLAFAATATQTVEGEPPTDATTQTASPDLNRPGISEIITRMRPSANPLDTITRRINNKIQNNAWKYEWYTSDIRGIEDTLATAFDTSESSTVTESGTVHEIHVNNIHIWSKHDVGRFDSVNGGNSRPLTFYVVKKESSVNRLYVLAVNGTGDNNQDFPDVPVDSDITRLGVGKSELAAQHSPYSTFPTKDYNYAQRFMAQVEQSVFQELHKKEVKWGYNDYRLQALFDLRRSMELNTLFGERGYLYDPEEDQYVYLTGGVTQYIDKLIEYTTAISNSDFAAWGRDIFQGNAGTDQRVLFAGDDLMVELAKVDSIQKQLDAGQTKVVYGIRFNRIETTFGELLIKNHELMRNVGWSSKGVVLDMPNIDRFAWGEMKTKEINLKDTGQRNVQAEKIEETFGLALRYPETHAIIQPA